MSTEDRLRLQDAIADETDERLILRAVVAYLCRDRAPEEEVEGAPENVTLAWARGFNAALPDCWPSAKVMVHEDEVRFGVHRVTAELYAPGLPPGVYDMWLPDPAQESAAGASSAEAKPAPDGRETSGSDKPRGLGNTGPDEEENPKS